MSSTDLITRESAIRLLGELEEAGCLSPIALDVPDDLSENRFDALCAYLGSLSHATRWWIGDLICWGEGRYKDRVAQASELFGLAPGTLQNYASVCDRIAPRRRRAGVPFHCHALVARLEPSAQDHWLGQAAERGLDYRELRDAMEKAGAMPPAPPKPAWTKPSLPAEVGPPTADAAEAAGAAAPAGTGQDGGEVLLDGPAGHSVGPSSGDRAAVSPHVVILAQMRDRYDRGIDLGAPQPGPRRLDLMERERDALNWALAALAPDLA